MATHISSMNAADTNFKFAAPILICVLAVWMILAKAADGQEEEALTALEDNVVFIFDPVRTSEPCSELSQGQTPIPLGTGFLVGIPAKANSANNSTDKDRWIGLNFLITAKHVVSGGDRIIVRLNRADHSRFICSTVELRRQGESQNVFVSSKPEVDLAAITYAPIAGTDPGVIPYQNILDPESMKAREVGEGTDVFTIGYLFGYGGQHRNYPVKKFGKIALLTEEEWFVTATGGTPQKAYLVELQNVPGLSGAPLILQSPRLLIRNNALAFSRGGPYLIGVVKALMWAPMTINQLMSQGVAAVEPGEELKDLLQQVAARYASNIPLDLRETPVPH